MNDKKIVRNNLAKEDGEKIGIYLRRTEVKREDLCTLREAVHYAFFGILPGSKYDANKADVLVSELVNTGRTGLHLSDAVLSQSGSFSFDEDTIAYEALRQKENARLKKHCPFFALRQPKFSFYERDCTGEFQNINYNPIFRYFNACARPEGLSYRFESLIKRTQRIFVSLSDLKRVNFSNQFHKFWEENRNKKCYSIKIDNLISLIPGYLRDKALPFFQKIAKSFLRASADVAVIHTNDEDQECMLKQLHNDRVIYVNNWYEEAKFHYIVKDSNYIYLENCLSIMQGVLNEKDWEARLELSYNSENRWNLELPYKGKRVVLKTLHRNCIPYHFLNKIISSPGEFFSKEEINNFLNSSKIKSIQEKKKHVKAENIEHVENFSKIVNNIFRLTDAVKKELKELHPELEVKNLIKRFFIIKGNSICYTPFAPKIAEELEKNRSVQKKVKPKSIPMEVRSLIKTS